MTQLLVGVAIGLVPGFFIGRLRAEWGRGRDEARSAWGRRHAYRK